jgi:nicotinate-nucleotide adenylyltransferase
VADDQLQPGPVRRGLGVLGGSFNPPHLGHLAVAIHALEELALERVLLMPLFLAPHRPAAADDPGAAHRLAMCRLLIADDRLFAELAALEGGAAAGNVARAWAGGGGALEVSTLEVERGGRSYTVDTLRALRAIHPDAELTLVLGADMAVTLPSWREPGEILGLARVAVAERDSERKEIVGALRKIDDRADATFLQMVRIDVSSTEVRSRLAGGLPVEEQVGPAVASYIASHGLYGSGVKAGVS